MRVVDALVIFLIAGILSSTSSGKQIPKSISRRELGLTESIVGADDETRNRIKEKCAAVAGPTAYSAVEEGAKDFLSCAQAVVDIPQFKADGTAAFDNNKWNGFFKKYCAKLPSLQNCGNIFTDAFKPCLTPSEQEQYDVLNNASISSLEYLCHDDGSRLTSFIDTGGLECFMLNHTYMKSCITDGLSGHPELYEQKFTSLYELGEQECKAIQTVRDCAVTTMKGCRKPHPADLVQSFFDIYITASPCGNILEVESSSTTETLISTIRPEDNLSEEESAESMFREKCEKNGGADAYDDWEESREQVIGCYQLMANTSRFMEEMNNARSSNGALEPVFKKYCRRVPIIEELEKYAADALKTCLEPEEKRSIDILRNITAMTLEFLCYGEGHRLATFVTTDGPQCLILAGDSIADCGRQSYRDYIKDIGFGGGASAGPRHVGDIPRILRPEFSTALENFRNCSIEVLAECETNMTSNLMNVLIDSIQNKISKGIETQLTEISGTTAAPKLNPNLEEWLQTVSDIEIITGLYDLNGTSVSDEDVKRYIQGKCSLNGGPNAYDKVQGIPSYISSGIKIMKAEALPIAKIVLFTESSQVTDKMNARFEDYCKKLPTLEKHLDYIADSVKPCLNLKDREYLDATRIGTTVFLNYVCENQGNNIIGLFTYNSMQCIFPKQQGIQICSDQLTAANRLRASQIERCNQMTKFQQCIVKELNECEDHAPAEVLGSLIDHFIVDVTPCKALLNA